MFSHPPMALYHKTLADSLLALNVNEDCYRLRCHRKRQTNPHERVRLEKKKGRGLVYSGGISVKIVV
jgi:hypothetical protein